MRSKSKRRSPAATPKRSRWTSILIGVAVVLGIAALGYLLYLSLQEPEVIEGLSQFIGLESGHDETVDYSGGDLPPVGGIHSGVWQNCGVYDEPVLAKNAVHSMEHGAVWIAYDPELPQDSVDSLRQAVRGESYTILSPYPGLKSPVVLTAWGIQLELESAEDERIPEFIDRYEQGPQTPERGALCSEGTGAPIS
ncbi:MAG: DUF3105 domain-containing protein [Candidatus Promineifilaceae bacterium]|jgi:hypothetical protein